VLKMVAEMPSTSMRREWHLARHVSAIDGVVSSAKSSGNDSTGLPHTTEVYSVVSPALR
jgi:hypothetical protein